MEPGRSARRSRCASTSRGSTSSSARATRSERPRPPLELDCVGEANGDACADADFIVLAVNAEAALDTARELRAAIGETPVLSVASELRFSKDGVLPATDARSRSPSASRRSSLALSSQACTRSRHRASAPTHPPDEDAFVCGDDADAKALGLELAERLTTGRALDAGPLASARALEGLTAVIVNMNKRYKGHAGIQVTGLP